MENNVLEALKLMTVGLVTVFVVLSLIIQGGKALIKAVNAIAPEEEAAPASKKAPQAVSPAVAKAIEKAVDTMTNGKAHVVSIEKL